MRESEYIAGVVTKLAYLRFKYQWGKEILLFSTMSRPALGQPCLLFTKYQGSFPGKSSQSMKLTSDVQYLSLELVDFHLYSAYMPSQSGHWP
jgi:hypothetical protein